MTPIVVNIGKGVHREYQYNVCTYICMNMVMVNETSIKYPFLLSIVNLNMIIYGRVLLLNFVNHQDNNFIQTTDLNK